MDRPTAVRAPRNAPENLMGWKRLGPNNYSRTEREGKRKAAERQTEELIKDSTPEEAARLLGIKMEEVSDLDRRTAVQASVQPKTDDARALRAARRALRAAGLLGKYYKGPRLR